MNKYKVADTVLTILVIVVVLAIVVAAAVLVYAGSRAIKNPRDVSIRACGSMSRSL